MASAVLIAALLFTAIPVGSALAGWKPSAASPTVGCNGVMRVIASSANGPINPGGGSRLKDLDYFVPFTGYNDDGKQAAFGFVTPDVFCGPYPPTPETIASSPSVNLSGPHAGLEPDGKTFVIVLSDDGTTYILERRSNATYTNRAVLHTGYTGISMQRINDSLDRLTISAGIKTGAIATQTVRTAESSTWGAFLTTPFRASFGATGKTRRATAAWTGNPDSKTEIAMTWAYDSNQTGYRVIRSALNPNYRTNDKWSAARTLVSIEGKDLTDPRITRWGDETRVYFMERAPDGTVFIDYLISTDYARTWSSVQRIRIPSPVSQRLTKLTVARVDKSRDLSNPIGLIGGFDPMRGLYELVAFVAPP
jgi:hypothetical protein